MPMPSLVFVPIFLFLLIKYIKPYQYHNIPPPTVKFFRLEILIYVFSVINVDDNADFFAFRKNYPDPPLS